MLKTVGGGVAVVVFVILIAWMSGRIPGTDRNTAHEAGYNKPEVRGAGRKIKWGDKSDDAKAKRDFSIIIRDGTTPDEQLAIKTVYRNKTPEQRELTTRWIISNHYGVSNPAQSKVTMFTSLIVNGVDIVDDGGELGEVVKDEMYVAEQTAALTAFDVGATNKRLYNPETGMCLARDDGNRQGDGFKAELVECEEATGFDIVGETLVAGVAGESVCFPFDKSKSANAKISAASSNDAKGAYVSTHPCNLDFYKANKDDDGYFVGVGPKCFTTDASGKNLKVSASNCIKKDRRSRFELKEKSEIVSGSGVREPLGA